MSCLIIMTVKSIAWSVVEYEYRWLCVPITKPIRLLEKKLF